MNEQRLIMEQYYHLHAPIYDLTRWSFLFGRHELIQQAVAGTPPVQVLEVGCGTGRNLAHLAACCPQAQVAGLDAAAAMLERCRARLRRRAIQVRLVHGLYDEATPEAGAYDLIVFSYSLSMFNPGWENALEAAGRDLRPGGRIAVCDFHDTPVRFFRWWMGQNHVRMDGHLLPQLRVRFPNHHERIKLAYGGLWRYFLFIGVK